MQSVIEAMNSGQINVVTGVLTLVLALVGGVVGGAIGGVIVGGKHLGGELAAMLGGFYGPLAAIPGVVIALIILAFV